MSGSINLAEKLASFSGHWQPRVVGQFNGHDLLVVKVLGEFVWHAHPDTDDFFLVLKGKLRQRPIYELTHDGFAVVAMGFTGPEAMAWKWKFLAAFRQQERDLADLQARYVAALDTIRPKLRSVVQDFADGMARSDTALWLDCSVASVSYQRSQARRLGLLAAHRAGGAA